jgi:hypothetical protein
MDLPVTTIVEALRAIHREAAELLDGVDAWDLHRSPPVSQTNSVAVLIHHAVNAEMQIVREVVGLPAPRDRVAESTSPRRRWTPTDCARSWTLLTALPFHRRQSDLVEPSYPCGD